jgi:uncharacterized membrane protein YkoI
MLGPSGKRAVMALLALAGMQCARNPMGTIGRVEAERIALATGGGKVLGTQSDSDGSQQVWRVEIALIGTRYRRLLEVDANTGRVISEQLDVLPDGQTDPRQ